MVPLPEKDKTFHDQEVTVLVAQMLFGEARGEPEFAIQGVACVAMNRLVHYRKEYGIRDWAGILLHPFAFDCFKAQVPQMQNPLHYESESVWEKCYGVAMKVMSGQLHDHPVAEQRCTFYHSFNLEDKDKLPYWAKPGKHELEHVIDLGHLHFYRYPEMYTSAVGGSSIEEGALGG